MAGARGPARRGGGLAAIHTPSRKAGFVLGLLELAQFVLKVRHWREAIPPANCSLSDG